MAEEGFLSRYVGQPVTNFYNYVTGKKEVSDDTHNTANQESSEFLDIGVQSRDVQSNENDII